MASLTVRQIPDELMERIKSAARDHGRSMEEELRQHLAEAYPPNDRAARYRELAALLEEWSQREDEAPFDPSSIEPLRLRRVSFDD